MHTGEKPFPCSYCDRAFTTNRTLKNHVRIHTGEKAPVECSTCGKGFEKQNDLEKHESMHKPAEERTSFVCEECGKSFVKEKSLTDHEAMHKGEITASCPKCGKGFFSESLMKKHFWRCQIALECDKCGQTFREKYLWKKHLLTHNDEDEDARYDSDCSEIYEPRPTKRTPRIKIKLRIEGEDITCENMETMDRT